MGHLRGSVWCVKWNSGGYWVGDKNGCPLVAESRSAEEISHGDHVQKKSRG